MNKTPRLRWIIALQQTIAKYEQSIENKVKPIARGSKCPLCTTARDIELKAFGICPVCIHMSEYGSGKHCSEQASCKAAMSFYLLNNNNQSEVFDKLAIKYRIHYLKSIIIKLKHEHN